jgi:pimeloyl-ACP methyl ester carboxylesterase
MNTDFDPTLLAELRELHQSERAPVELERRVLERVLPARVRGKAPLGARPRVWWNRGPLGWTVLGATLAALAAVVLYSGMLHLDEPSPGEQALSSEPARVLGPEPRSKAGGEARRDAHCPLDELPAGFADEAPRIEPPVRVDDLELDTFAMSIPGCPALVRSAVNYVPSTLSLPSRAPLLLFLHNGGDSAEDGAWPLRRQASLEALAEREGFIIVYANAAPAASRFLTSGFWQTDPEGANRSIDDFAYLARVVERLEERGLVERSAAGPDVYLVGYGSGARLALEAAARHPERYAGVAALLPDKINAFRPPPRRADTRLSRMLFVALQDGRPWAYWPGVPLDMATLDEWAAAVGLPPLAFQQGLEPQPQARLGTVGSGDEATRLANAMSQASPALRQVVPAGTRVLDVGEPDQGGAAVRVLVVPNKDTIEVGRDGRPAPLDVTTLIAQFLLSSSASKPDVLAP